MGGKEEKVQAYPTSDLEQCTHAIEVLCYVRLACSLGRQPINSLGSSQAIVAMSQRPSPISIKEDETMFPYTSHKDTDQKK